MKVRARRTFHGDNGRVTAHSVIDVSEETATALAAAGLATPVAPAKKAAEEPANKAKPAPANKSKPKGKAK